MSEDGFTDGDISIRDIYTGTGNDEEDAKFMIVRRRMALALAILSFFILIPVQVWSGYTIAHLIERMVISVRGSDGSSPQ